MHAIHNHDLLTWLMGPAAKVFAQTATRVNPIEVEDCAVAVRRAIRRLPRGIDDGCRIAGQPRRCRRFAGARHRALPFGGDWVRRNSADWLRQPSLQQLVPVEAPRPFLPNGIPEG